jgi:hypothetical protein
VRMDMCLCQLVQDVVMVLIGVHHSLEARASTGLHGHPC